MDSITFFMKRTSYALIAILIFVVFNPKLGLSQIQVSNSQSVQNLVNNYFAGDGVIISNISFTGQSISMGSFTNAASTNIGMNEGVILSTGSVLDIVGPNNWPNTQTNTLGGSDPDLAALLPGFSINDAIAIEFDFIPLGDTLRFKYVFASEEYPEWVGSGYNDVLGFFISGANPTGGSYTNQNMAIVPGTTNTPLTITSINNGTTNTGPCVNCSYYIDNVGGTSIEYDGFTTVLTAWILVDPCTNYHIKFAIGDGNDHSYDSGVFLEKESFRTNVVRPKVSYTTPGMNTSAVEACNNAIVSFTLGETSQTNQWVNYSIGGTAINGVDFPNIPDSVYIAAGVDSVGFMITPSIDGITEGAEYVELIVNIASCYNDTLIIPINDYNPVDVHITGDSAFCYGDSTVLTANIIEGFAPFSFQWNTLDTNQQIHIAPIQSSNYIVNVTDGCGFINADTAHVIIYELPTFSIIASQDSICPGDSTLLVINGGISFDWNPKASLTPTSGDSVYAFPNIPTTYTAIGIDSNLCGDTTQITISLKSLPIIQVSPTTDTICRNDSVNIIATGGVSYEWNPIVGISNPSGSNIYASPNSTTIYIVKGTGSNSCHNYDTTSIIVESIPNLHITPATPIICIGNSVSLIASGAINYTWTPANGLTSTTTDTTTASPIVTTSYIVEGIDSNNCTNKDTVIVNVAPLPSLSISPSNTQICNGDSALLKANGAHSYQWIPNVNMASNLGDSIYASPLSNTTYTVIGIDSNSCIDSTHVIVNVSLESYITTNDSILCIGDTTILSANIASGTASYVWSFNSATTSSITINPTTSSYFTVTATDQIGCVTMDSIEVIVNPQPVLVINPNIASICLGDSINVSASGALNYAWTPLTNNSSPNSASTYLSPIVASTYTVIGTDVNSCLDTATIALSVNPLPIVNVTPTIDTICINGTTTLTASGANTYSWIPTSGLSPTTGSIVIASPSSPTNYIVVGTDTNSCSNQDTAFIFVSPVLNVTASPSLICNGDSTLLTVTSNVPSTYVWSTGITDTLSSFWVSNTTTTTYTVTATTANGCQNTASIIIQVYNIPTIQITPDSSSICKGNSVSLTASGGATYAWVANSALSSLTGATVLASPNATDTFYVTGIDQWGCYNVAQSIVYIDSSLVISASPSAASICLGDSIELTSTGNSSLGGGIIYTWSPTTSLNTTTGDSVIANPNATQIYTIVGTAINGCTDTVYSTITVNPNPIITANPNNIYICEGDSVYIQASGATSYFWHPSSSLSSNNLSHAFASPIATTTYTIVGQNQYGCIDSTTSTIGVDQYPTLSLNPQNISICPNDSILLTASGAFAYFWSPSTNLSSNTGAQVYANPDSTMQYTVFGSSTHGCSDTITGNITVSPIPVISGVDTICLGDTTILSVISNTPTSTFSWSNGATSSSIIVNPIVTTTYIVIATDGSCSNDTSFTVVVDSVEIPIINPINPNLCPGDSVMLSVINIYNNPTYLWNTGSTSDSLLAQPTNTTSYTVTVSLANSCSRSNSVNVNIYNDPTVSISTSTPLICYGDTAYLSAQNSVSYSWTGNNLLSATGSTVSATPSSNSLYEVTGLSVHNCESKDTVTIYLYPTAQINLTASQSVICDNDTAHLSASGALSFLWSPNSFISSITGANVDVYPLNDQVYSVIGINQDGCKDTTSILIEVNHGPTINVYPDSPLVCQGDTVLIVANGAQSYSWTPLTSMFGANNDSLYIFPTANIIYYVTGIDSIGCTGDTSVYVNVKRKPFISVIPIIDSICDGDSVDLLAHGAVSYSWSPNGTLSNPGLDSVSVTATPSATTTYTVTGTSSDGCYKSATAKIHVYPNPIIQINPSIANICYGDSIQIIVNGANNYQWSPTTDIQLNTTLDTAISTAQSSQIYRVIGDNQYGCVDSVFSSIIVHQLPTVNISAVDTILCDRDSTLITVTGANTYSWSPNTGISSNTGSSNYCSSSSTVTYYIIGTDTNNCIDDDSIEIQVLPSPTINVSVSDTLICSGDFIALSGSSSSSSTSYLWSNGATTANTSDNPTTNITYQLIGTDPNTCNDSADVFVQVNPFPILNLVPQNSVLCYSDTINITSNCNLGNLSYNWSNGAVSNNIIVNPLVDTFYTLIVSDSIGCSDTATSIIDVVPNPTVFITATDTHICANAPTTLTANANSMVAYSWNLGNPTMANTYYPTTSNNYIVIVTDSNNCTATDSIFVLVNNQPQLLISSIPNSICIGDTAQLSVSSNIPTLTYLWNTGATTTSISTFPATTSIYSVVGSDSLGCSDSINYTLVVHNLPVLNITPDPAEICKGDAITLQLISNIPINQYLWSTSSTQSSITVGPNNTTSYSVVATDTNSCVDSTSRIVTVHSNPIVNITPKGDTICSGDSLQLTAAYNIVQAQILWNTGSTIFNPYFSPMLPNTYSVVITDSNGCNGYDTSLINVTPTPTCNITAQSPICSDDSSLVTYYGTATSAASTNWFFDGANVLSGNGISPHYLQWTNNGIYHITLDVTENGCTSMPDTAELIVFEVPAISMSVIDSTVCDPFPLDFISSIGGLTSYHWEFGDPLGVGKDTANIQNPSYTYHMPGIYGVSLLVTNSDGCSAYLHKNAMVEVYPGVNAQFFLNPPISYDREPMISFTDQSITPTAWHWEFDDIASGTSNISNLKDPFHIYQQAGTYHPLLVAMNSYGCTDTASAEVIIYEPSSFYIPNAFTPDGDGLNDLFFAKGLNFDESTFEIYIYNRWGKQVYQSFDFKEGWDGNDYKTGIECPAAVYSYVIRFKDNQEKNIEHVGSITLIR